MNPLIRPAPEPSRRFRLKMMLRRAVIDITLLRAGVLAIPVCICTFLMESLRWGADRILRALDS